MSADPSPSLREELSLHAAWVRRLAGRLVRDERAAEDLAQETVLAALRNRNPIRGALRPWLARVASNLARRSWREAETRHAGERAVARGEALPAADEGLGRLEIQEQLIVELKGLAEPSRSVLLRRYFDGWSAARIAEERGLPASTVRWHLQRGLDELRARLDRRQDRDGLRWRPALLAYTRWRPPVASTTHLTGSSLLGSLHGVMAMKVSAQLLVAGVALLTGLGVFLVARPESTPLRGRGVEPGPRAVAEAEPSAEERAQALESPPARVALPAKEPETQKARAQPAAEPPSRVDGRCVDQTLVPVAGARVVLDHDADATSRDVPQDAAEGVGARSAGDGTFVLEGPADDTRSARFRVEAAGYGTRFVSAVLATDGSTHLGDIVLAPGGSVRGRVLQASGAPFPGAEVRVTETQLWDTLDEARRRGPSRAEPSLCLSSERDGTFLVRGVAAGMVRVWASAPDMLHALTGPLEVPAHGEPEEVVLTLEPREHPDALAVRVLDPRGEPVPNARVAFTCRKRSGGSLVSSQPTDAHGRVELPAPPGSSFDLSAVDPDERWFPVSLRGVVPTAEECALAFVETPWIEVLARAGGEPVEEYSLAACALDASPSLGPRARHPDGRARVHAPPFPFRVFCDAPGYRVSESPPFAPEATPATLVFELQPEPGLRGRVLVYGEPVAGARVTLHDADPRKHIDHDGYPSFQLPEALDTALSDAEGRFVLRARERGEFVVRAEAAGLAAADVGPFAFEPLVGRTDIELALTHGGALEGRVFLAAGREPSGVIVAANRGDAHARTLRSGVDGRFRFEGLTPGRWCVARGKLEVEGNGNGGTAYEQTGRVELDFNCTVVDGETTTCNVDLRDWQPCLLQGELAANGEPLANWGLQLWPAGRSAMVGDLPNTSTDAEGRFRFELEDAGRVRLVLAPPSDMLRGGTLQGGTLALEFELHPGENPWKADLTLGSLTGTITDPIEGVLYYEASGPGPSCMLPLVVNADGRFSLAFVPAGHGAIQCLQGSGAERTTRTLLETDVPAGGTREIRLP